MISPGTFPTVQLRLAAIAPGARQSLLDGVEERDRSMAVCAGARGNRSGRQETEENGPENEENEIGMNGTFYVDAQGLYNSYITPSVKNTRGLILE